MQGSSYRFDIDGLRAVSVLAIVLFHFRFPALAGGFVGVDVFFVVSGFLIGRIVLTEVREGRFSFAQFYERRARRILPAFFAMALAVTAAMVVWFLPNELEEFGRSLLAALTFTSNVFFWTRADYFSAVSDLQPLLHTWSLSMEEQFYLFFPLAAFLLHRYARRAFVPALVGVAVISFSASVWATAHQPDGAYYLPYSRIWEMIAGLAVVFVPTERWFRERQVREAAAALGALLIVAPMFLYTTETPFPGLAALPSCLGAMLVLATGAQGPTIVRRVLSLRPLVAIGLISYSLYLWHWPVVVVYRTTALSALTGVPSIGRWFPMLLCFGIAGLSWRFVEQPFRSRTRQSSATSVLRFAGLGALGLCAIAAVLVGFHGFPKRFPAEALRMAKFLNYDSGSFVRRGRCYLTRTSVAGSYDSELCLGSGADRPRALVLGDSMAAHLWFGLSRALPNIEVLQATATGCKPLLKLQGRSICVDVMRQAFETFLPKTPVETLYLAARWTEPDLDALVRTVGWARSHQIPVVVFGPMVDYEIPLPRLLARAAAENDFAPVARSRRSQTPALDARFRAAVVAAGARYVSFFDTLCDAAGTCRTTTDNGTPLLFDGHHLTREGSEETMRAVVATLKADSTVTRSAASTDR